MLAVDTNVIVRFLTDDHPQQSPRARRLVDGNDMWVSMTVLLETEWVLRSAYRFTPAQIVDGLRDFAGLPRVSLENPALVARAWTGAPTGMDFADALHLSAASTLRGVRHVRYGICQSGQEGERDERARAMICDDSRHRRARFLGPVLDQPHQRLQPVRLGRRLVGADAGDAREAQGDAGFVPRRELRGVERDFQHQRAAPPRAPGRSAAIVWLRTQRSSIASSCVGEAEIGLADRHQLSLPPSSRHRPNV